MPASRTAAPTATPPDEAALSPARRRLFLGITLGLPWALLLLLELALRLAGYGSSSPLFVRHPVQQDWMVVNPRVAERWFRGSPFVPTPEVDFFRATKAPGALRVFFMGESSAQGFPYGHGGMPSRMLEQRLQATFPGRDVEVVNTAFTAVSSYALLDEADEIAGQQPDAILIYTGHNEWYGVLGAVSTTGTGSRLLARASLLVRHVRTLQLVDAFVRHLRPAPASREAPRTVMQMMAGDRLVPIGSPAYEAGIAQFRDNLGALLERFRARGIPVLVATVASNVHDQPPLEGGAGEAARTFAKARALEVAGDTIAARAAWLRAKDEDALRFRAPEALNAIVREVAAAHGATVVDVEAAMAARSPGGVVGRSLMLEHLHPNLDGYLVMADAFYEAMRARGIGGPWTRAVPADSLRAQVAVTPIDSLVGAWRTDRLTSGWPFTPRGRERTPVVDTLHPRTEPERLAQAVVLGQLPWAEATERLRDAAERAGDHALALRAARAMAQEYAWSAAPCLDAARAARALGDDAQALAWARLAQARGETAEGASLLGLLLLQMGDRAAAIVALRRAADLMPGDRRAVAVLHSAEALPSLEQRRAAAPTDSSVLYEIALAYAFTGQDARAREAVATLRRVAPGFSKLGALSVIEHEQR